MNQPIKSFLLVLLIEGICALASYLTERLMRHMRERDHDYGFNHENEYA